MKFKEYLNVRKFTPCCKMNEMEDKHGIFFGACYLNRGHYGNHKFSEMCNINNNIYVCFLPKKHTGEHQAYKWHWDEKETNTFRLDYLIASWK